MLYHDDIEAVKQVLSEYEKVPGAKINMEKSEGLQLGPWTGGVSLSDLFC